MEHVDVLIVGAGLSGVGAAHHLRSRFSGKSLAILEGRADTGGTWDLFRYPGIRSDSDMYTLGYSFKPWEDAEAIADGPSILSYVRQTAREDGTQELIRLNHRVVSADWSSPQARWTVHCRRTDTGEALDISAGFLLMCTGYYSYTAGHTPDFAGVDSFQGRVVHPQFWTDDIEYAGRRVIVIGSGATAITLVPSLAREAEHVTMLQRSPSHLISLPAQDAIADELRRRLPGRLAYSIVRWKNVLLTSAFFQGSRHAPGLVSALIRRRVAGELPAGYDVERDFRPRYDPWDQRICVVPDGDLFKAIGAGRASVVTGEIETFIRSGIRLTSGQELAADLIVTATGLSMEVFGGAVITVDGVAVDPASRMTYRGIMLGGIPNLAMTFGYTNASWTLKCDLTCEYVCRLLAHMDERGYVRCAPRDIDVSVLGEPFMDLSSGYVTRALSRMPKQGPRAPWRLHQNYVLDILSLRHSEIEDGDLLFTPAGACSPAREPERAAA